MEKLFERSFKVFFYEIELIQKTTKKIPSASLIACWKKKARENFVYENEVYIQEQVVKLSD